MRKKLPNKAAKKTPPTPPPPDPSGEELFLRAMADVVPLERRTKRVLPSPAKRSARLDRLEKGLDGSTAAIAPAAADATQPWNTTQHGPQRLVKRLKRGGFPVEEDLDLHGFTQAQARKELEVFLREASQQGLTCVRIIHGKGWNSPNGLSVLRKRVPEWLTEAANSKLVAAFASARMGDGGTGAVYVLLRNDKGRGV